ncbi:MFS transporter [Leptothoe sp. EHU-05/26/07-4]
MISTGVAFSDVVADKLMVVEGQKQGNANILQASQWAGLGFTAIAMYGLGGWLAEHTPLSTVFLLSTIFPGIGFIAVLSFFPEQPNKTFTLGRSWQQFWQVAKQPNLKLMLGLILLLDISPTPVDYVYQRQILDFSNTLIGNLKAVECLGLGLGAIAFGILTQRFPKLPLLRLVIISGAISLLSLSFMQDVSSAYGVYLVRGFTVTLRTLGLFGLVVQICPQGAEGFTYALMVSVANLATNIGLLWGGQLYDWGISFAMVAIIGSLYILLCGGGISLIAVYSDKLRGF